MNQPIRSMPELVEALRIAQIERSISYETIEHITGMARGSVAKYLAPEPSKNLGPMSAFDIAFGLGKGLAIVDDPQAIAAVQEHWKKRAKTGGASIQVSARSIRPASQEKPINIEELMKIALSARMREIGMKGNKSSKRRAAIAARRARQRRASHAARKRWAKRR